MHLPSKVTLTYLGDKAPEISQEEYASKYPHYLHIEFHTHGGVLLIRNSLFLEMRIVKRKAMSCLNFVIPP